MSVVSFDVGRELRVRGTPVCRPIEVGLLGCGNVGAAFAALTQQPHRSPSPVQVATALVRDARRDRPTLRGEALRTQLADEVFSGSPDVIVELLGGTEPARTLVLEALHRRIPVVTANKSLLAAHGRELRDAAANALTPLLYEAAVIAGVPFLGTFARRPYAAQITSITGIANGTSNYVLTRAATDRTGIDAALTDAQRLGLAEPDPSNDIDGIDALEKLVVLLQHFAGVDVPVTAVECRGIRTLSAAQIEQAASLDGVIKPIIHGDWTDGVQACVGPAFVPHGHLLSNVDGAENALVLGGPRGRMVFRGPGAGPAVTAATVLDDVIEATSAALGATAPALQPATVQSPESEWFVSVSANRLPRGLEIADLLSSFGVFIRRAGQRQSTDGVDRVAALTWPCERPCLERALAALDSAADCRSLCFRALGS